MTLRILHCPLATGGNPQGLARAERKIGLQSWAVSFTESPFQYESDEILWRNPAAVLLNELSRWKLLGRALKNFDVVHFNFGTAILPKSLDPTPLDSSRAQGFPRRAYNVYARLVEFRDLSLLRRFKKAVFVTYQGDDARQADYCRAHFRISTADEVDPDYYRPGSDERKRREITCFDRYADGIFALNPDLLHVLPARARFLPYAHVDLDEWTPNKSRPGLRPRPLIVHAPSHRGFKGSRYIFAAVDRLKSEGVSFDFVVVENLPNAEARKIYAEADLVVDQLLAGWYGGLAVECMALGRPVICYIREEDLPFIESEMRAQLPVIQAEPGTIYDVLKDCLTVRRVQLPQIGEISRAYVEKWHDPIAIAMSLKERYIAALHRQRATQS